MAFCAQCGSQVEGRFCAKCGTPVAAPADPPPPAGPPPGAYGAPPPNQPPYQAPAYGAPPPPAAPASAGLEENMACALCYLLAVLTGVLFLVMEPYSKNRTIRFHAFQSIFTWLGMVVIGIGVAIVGSLVGFLPFVGWLIYIVLWAGFVLGSFALWVMLMYKAYNKEMWVLPVVGPLAQKQV